MKSIFVLESQIYASLAHPKRLEILHLLSHGELSVSQIQNMTGLTQANVSQHLMVLNKLKLVQSKKVGLQRLYTLTSAQLPILFEKARTILLERFGVNQLEKIEELHLHVDPVCHMEVTQKGAAASVVFDHKRYFFCATGCAKRFEKEPKNFIINKKELHV